MKEVQRTIANTKLESVRKSLDILTSFLTPALPFINAHNVDFFTKSYWINYMPQKIREDADKTPITFSILKSHVADLCTGAWRKSQKPLSEDVTFNNCTLQELVQKIGELRLENMGMAILPDELFLKSDSLNIPVKAGITEADLKFDNFMSPKKMHEVEAISYLVYRAAKATALANEEVLNQNLCPIKSTEFVDNLIDFGSGKGYMSSFLALLYKFRVLALDASPGNTAASQERSERLRKTWIHLLRRASERAETGTCVSSRAKSYKKRQNADQYLQQSTHEENIQNGSRDEIHEICDNLTNLQLVVHNKLDLDALLHDQVKNDLLPPTTKPGFGIVGLHTCGGLGVDSIHLFLQHERALFLCNVPCCYHHLEEMNFPSTVSEVNSPHSRSKKKSGNFWSSEDSAVTEVPTFPLSSYLQLKEFNLGRNARMLSSYSHQRIREELEETGDVDMYLIWRLLLQVIIQEKLGHTLLEYQVGKLGRKCATFEEYVYKALKKLHLNDIMVTDEEIKEVYQRHEPYFKNFHCYYTIRTMLAPLLEACIFLDRLAFLLEQENVQDAFIVKVFDELISPRAHAILAFKTQAKA